MSGAARDRLALVVRSGEDAAGLNGGNLPRNGPLYPLTDLGNAERFVARHGADSRYVGEWGRWLIWNGSHWAPDTTGAVGRRAKDTVRAIYAEAAGIEDADRRQDTWKHAVRSENGGRIRQLIERAQDEEAVASTPGAFDTDPMLMTCANGTLDLRTGSLREHRRDDLISKAVAVPYRADAEAPLWRASLHRWMGGNERLLAFLQRAAGYSLTGLTGEEVLFFCFGTGRNGKSRFIGALQHVMGDYARTLRPEALMVTQGTAIPNEIAALVGVRLVSTIEIEEGARLAESLVKQLTGGDRVSARFMRAEFFDFQPRMKIWMAGNHKPNVRGTDRAIWERILTIPFTVTIPQAERDRDLAEKLRQEGPGIFAWMVEGCLQWQEQGLDPPAEVRAATDEYRSEMDVLGMFLGDCCEVRYEAVVPATALYDRYREWCKGAGEREWSQQLFGRKLAEHGFQKDRQGQTRVWQGLDVLDKQDQP